MIVSQSLHSALRCRRAPSRTKASNRLPLAGRRASGSGPSLHSARTLSDRASSAPQSGLVPRAAANTGSSAAAAIAKLRWGTAPTPSCFVLLVSSPTTAPCVSISAPPLEPGCTLHVLKTSPYMLGQQLGHMVSTLYAVCHWNYCTYCGIPGSTETLYMLMCMVAHRLPFVIAQHRRHCPTHQPRPQGRRSPPGVDHWKANCPQGGPWGCRASEGGCGRGLVPVDLHNRQIERPCCR